MISTVNLYSINRDTESRDMGELAGRGSQYTDEQRRQAVAIYASKGIQKAVCDELNIPDSTVSHWTKQDWWQDMLGEIRNENQNEHIALYHEITRKALDKAHKSIDNLGDDLSASDVKALVVTGATATDKARLLLNQPTSIKADSSGIQDLAQQFAQLSQQWTEKQANVVATQAESGVSD